MKTHDIESSKNQIFKDFLALLKGPGIVELKKTLIAGAKMTKQLSESNPENIEGVIATKEMVIEQSLTAFNLYRLTSPLFKELDVFGTKSPIVVAKTPVIKKIESKLSGCSLLLLLQDPSNVGALLRSAAAFGVNQIILGPGCSNPFHPKSSRASSGTLFLHSYYQIKNLEELEPTKNPIIALDLDGKNLKTFKFPKDFILVPGQEGLGLTPDLRSLITHTVSIPQRKSVESLNAMVAASIALYSWSQ